ncbi:RNA-guided endonuclease InsQ/TnpB family protein [Floridanema aerugineum]|uniref:RNA-guided endonuclease InsQ/TnpB family protein n=1 Tax=Floridaenema aerugineum BLCC-F46 TaxID=3153654 RepID=A0ABV4X7J5_9CYAN
MLTALKVRLYPSKEQQIALVQNFGCCRFVWNHYLNKSNTQYQETGKGLSYCDMAKDLTQLKKQEEFLWLKDASSSALQQSLKNLEAAFKNFFKHRAKFPKFKSRHKKQSLRYPAGCSVKGNGIQLPKLGVVKAIISKKICGKIKSVTVSKDSTDKYFAAILLEVEDNLINKEGKISGIDLGLSSLVTVFDGETTYKVDPIKLTRKYAKRLRRRQKSLSRKKLGSNNRKKQVKKVAEVHHKIANTRLDFLHKLSHQLVSDNQTLVVENLCVKGLARTNLAKSVLDAGLSMLVNFLDYKLKRVGGILVEVDRFFPSTKICNCCKHKNDSLTLKDRQWVCPVCQTHHDRDENAARNLREEGIKILLTNTVGQTEFQACGESVRLTSKGRNTSTRKQPSKKQESPAIA